MIERQVELEREMVDHGIQRYHRIRGTAEEGSRGSQTTYAQRLLPTMCIDLADCIEGAKVQHGPGAKAKYLGLLKGIDSNQAAFITLKVIFDALIKGGTVNNIAMQIGLRIEDQVRFKLFELDNDAYYDGIIKDFKKKKTVEYRHMRNVLRHVAKDRDHWVDWSSVERLHLGCKLIELAEKATALIYTVTRREGTNKSVKRIEATADAMEWIEEHMQEAELLHPEFSPCLIQPCDWVGLNDGGFYTPELRRRAPFVKIKSLKHKEALKGADLAKPMAAVNKLQGTAWEINTRVHDVIKEVWRQNLGIGMPAAVPYVAPECPLDPGLKKIDMTEIDLATFNAWKRLAARVYTSERERVSKSIQLSRVLTMAQKYRAEEEFYYVYNCDFRGRIYTASPGLTPQGADFSKGLLQFKKGAALGKRGFIWLCVQGANTYGYDKGSFDERVQWVSDRHREIIDVADDPLGSRGRSLWANADDPYQFFAFCFEYSEAYSNQEGFISHLPINMDGSCNGIQNFSAMLRDSVGGKSTNLTRTDRPNDIYQDVANVCIRKLEHTDDTLAKQWLHFLVTRGLCKKPVMTLPYGSTQQSCRESVEDYILDHCSTSPWDGYEAMRAAKYMSDVIWESISEVVIASRAAMGWLQKASRTMSKENLPIVWHTPLGFRVYQGTMKRTSQRVKTQLMGTCFLRLSTDTEEVDKYRQANGIAPNFVHSMDATHLMMTVLRDLSNQIQDWMMVHDSYGCHAGKVDYMRTLIQAAFYKLYSENDVLDQLRSELNFALIDRKSVVPPTPEYGTLDITEVLDAEYFFG